MNKHAVLDPFQTITVFVKFAEFLLSCVVISTFNKSTKGLTYHRFTK
jgi:hypothetical protein